jgi:hypothetical protein
MAPRPKFSKRAIEYLCEGNLTERIPLRMATIVAGPADVNKSSFVVKVAAHASNNGVNVVFSTTEDTPWDSVCVPRLEAAGANIKNIRVLDQLYSIPSNLETIERIIRTDHAGLFVMDTWDSHMDGGVYSRRLRENMFLFEKMLATNECAALGVHHTIRVTKGMRPLDAFGGAGQNAKGVVRMGYLMGVDPLDSDRRILSNAKWSNGPRLPSLVYEVDVRDVEVYTAAGKPRWDSYPFLNGPLIGEHGLTAEELVATLTPSTVANEPGRPPTKRTAAAEDLVSYFRRVGGSAHKNDVLAAMEPLQHSRSTVYRAMNDMGCSMGQGRNPLWSMPKDLLDRQHDFGDDGDDDAV